jgi:hypothetical protein
MERAGHSIRMYIAVSDMVQEGAVWPLQPVYDIIRIYRLHLWVPSALRFVWGLGA